MDKERIRANKKIQRYLWTKPELQLIAKFGGKIPIPELLEKINEIAPVERTDYSLRNKAAEQGFSLKFRA